MKAALADTLLAKVMQWTQEDVARERPLLQIMADLKYDAYQQFSPGMRFVESLALWLAQFQEIGERADAYRFVKNRLIFLSSAEMDHFSAVAYHDFIRPLLIEQAAKTLELPNYKVAAILCSEEFAKIQKTAIFCGLSDGARIDFFRRSNRGLSHEQIFQSYDLSDARLAKLAERLSSYGADPLCRTLVLLDDFSASGTSYIRLEGEKYDGKIAQFIDRAQNMESWKKLVRFPETQIILAIYVATDVAVERITQGAQRFFGEGRNCFKTAVVQRLSKLHSLCPDDDDAFVPIIRKYYDNSLEDEHTSKGGSTLRFGFNDGGLPLILHHNTPNNSLFLLWVEEGATVRALFPRVSRHRKEK